MAPGHLPDDDLYWSVSSHKKGLTDQFWCWNCRLNTLLVRPYPIGAFRRRGGRMSGDSASQMFLREIVHEHTALRPLGMVFVIGVTIYGSSG